MDASELQPLVQFMRSLVPFDCLPESSCEQVARRLQISYFSTSQRQVTLKSDCFSLYIVRSGAFEVNDPQGELLDRLGEGDYFGYPSLLSGEVSHNQVNILEDGLVYELDAYTFNELRSLNREFDRFFNKAYAKRLRNQARFKAKDQSTMSRIGALMSRPALSIELQASVADAAKSMTHARVSSVVVTDNQQLVGIVTDRDLRSRVLAAGLDGRTPVASIMTPSPFTVSPNTLVFEAMSIMSEQHLHHLPVLEHEQVVGMLTSSDIIRSQGSQPLLLIAEINRQTVIEKLISLSRRIPELLQKLISADARAEEIGRVLTSVTDALTRRLIELNMDLLGQAPMAFCWLAFGSQGRQDQVACSDQDNALLLAHEPDDFARDYFATLSEAVCRGLNDCGYVYCPGGIMAQNSAWRMSLTAWQGRFRRWVTTPEPKALMHASIFFDMRSVYGPESLFTALQDNVLASTKGNDIFLAGLTANALQTRPPLGFFRKFVLERDGSEVKGIDLKHRGNALVTDIARVYALSVGCKAVNTAKRLQSLMQAGVIDRRLALDLADAQEFIAHLRLANQGQQYAQQQPLSNYLKPGDISGLTRHQLKEAFKVVDDAQSGVRLRFLRSL
ncbi:DUF294 nucleotidyltransferase-like domain-containing protein [Shewanella sp. NIFS-20-20]|uniref:DUF294 nucleotidyltransferase-like domain-containing protein n=1 Tax=Shewanella sp. NIFS-20-20 TaxID=2853806 RepID=UPI001C481733|nr:DUF294 nucleotidyltransferase-like domain-containing protein [Shewanella sp. NIFS-20-20]MBV7315525.1 CBS domain-containing protein [Shewanella sp. NIFS-20-20]